MINLGTQRLESERLIIRKFEVTDKDELYNSYINQDEFLYYANKTRKTLNEVASYINDVVKKYQDDEYYNWVICLKENGSIIGSINMKKVENKNMLQVSYAIDNRYIKNGYMTEALKRIIKYCFEELELDFLQGGCIISNLASRRVMEKCDMKYFKTEKNYMSLNDGVFDMDFFKIEARNYKDN